MYSHPEFEFICRGTTDGFLLLLFYFVFFCIWSELPCPGYNETSYAFEDTENNINDNNNEPLAFFGACLYRLCGYWYTNRVGF